eukprot:g37311.t1
MIKWGICHAMRLQIVEYNSAAVDAQSGVARCRTYCGHCPQWAISGLLAAAQNSSHGFHLDSNPQHLSGQSMGSEYPHALAIEVSITMYQPLCNLIAHLCKMQFFTSMLYLRALAYFFVARTFYTQHKHKARQLVMHPITSGDLPLTASNLIVPQPRTAR